MENNELKIVYVVSDISNYYAEPVAVRVFDTEEKAINFIKNNNCLEYEEFEVE